jgi:hypothetical protein
MHQASRRRTFVTAAATLVIAATSATAAQAATVTVTGDDGNPVALAQGAPGAIRNMSPTVGIAFPPAAARFSATVTGPDGTAVSSALTCFTTSTGWTRNVTYRGNGNYTVSIANYATADTTCKTPTSQEAYVFAINGGVTLPAPAGPFLLRAPNSFSTNTFEQPVGLNPGTSSYELRYAIGGVVGPDGAITGPSDTGYVNQTTGTAGLTFKTPGAYTVVARASSGEFNTPWSAPVTIAVVAPFDLNNLSFPDSRGPSYRLRGEIRETSTRGRVNIAMARGKKGGKYKSLGSVKISTKGTFTKRFTQRTTGYYRVRVTYKGSSTTAGGTAIQQIRITRRLSFG